MLKIYEKNKVRRLWRKRKCCVCGRLKRFNLWVYTLTHYYVPEFDDYRIEKLGHVYCKSCFDKDFGGGK